MHGLILGKFMPPHRGHLYLVDFAAAFAQTLTVVVGSLPNEPIPGRLRYEWMRELFPHLNVVHLTDENPQYPHEHPNFWSIWKNSLERISPQKIDLLFASEDYGAELAAVLGARFIPLNGMRETVEISGTKIREQPLKHWDHIPRCVRPYFTRTVVFFGPESTGKTTLSRKLAADLGATWVPEYARTYLKGREDRFDSSDMLCIARGQSASMRAATKLGRPLVLSDTDALTTRLWCEELFDQVPAELNAVCSDQRADLTLLFKPDVPWVGGELRLRPETRERFFQKCQEALKTSGREYHIISGDWQKREEQIRNALTALS